MSFYIRFSFYLIILLTWKNKMKRKNHHFIYLFIYFKTYKIFKYFDNEVEIPPMMALSWPELMMLLLLVKQHNLLFKQCLETLVLVGNPPLPIKTRRLGVWWYLFYCCSALYLYSVGSFYLGCWEGFLLVRPFPWIF